MDIQQVRAVYEQNRKKNGKSKLCLFSSQPHLNDVVKFTPKTSRTTENGDIDFTTEEEQMIALLKVEAYLQAGGAPTTTRYYKDSYPKMSVWAIVSVATVVRHAISKQASLYGVTYNYKDVGKNFKRLEDVPPSIYETDVEMMELRGEV